jgi:hypothetical protein
MKNPESRIQESKFGSQESGDGLRLSFGEMRVGSRLHGSRDDLAAPSSTRGTTLTNVSYHVLGRFAGG